MLILVLICVCHLLTSVGILARVAVAMAIPHIDTESLSLVVVEGSKALVPSSL